MSEFSPGCVHLLNLCIAAIIPSLAMVLAPSSYGGTNKKPTVAKHPKLTRAEGTSYEFDGFLKTYLDGVSENWLKKMPDRNPGVLGMFTEEFRNTPYRYNPDVWDHRRHTLHEFSGEFAGKYLTGAVQVLRLTGDRELKDYLGGFVSELISHQMDSGYLGPWPKEYQLSGKAPNMEDTWDAWNHYHIMLGLLLWHEETGDAEAFAAARKIADLMCDLFLDKPGGILRIGTPNTNLAPVHALGILYRKTGRRQYLALARQIVDEEFPKDADYIGTIMAGNEYYQVPTEFGARWESVHALMGIVELYWITGEQEYKEAFERLWWSMLKSDRKNNGGYSTWERAYGDPYSNGATENCCVVAWAAMTVEMLKLTGNSIVADELELTFLNAGLGLTPRTGRWFAYNVPMEGARVPFIAQYTWHPTVTCREVACCPANGPRNLGILSDWALMSDEEGLALNWYGLSTMKTRVKGVEVTLKQKTDYPRTGRVLLEVTPSRSVEFDLKLRIPHWSESSQVAVNDARLKNVPPGEYLTLSRRWEKGDRIRIELDMSLHYWAGENSYEGKTSIYRGPILLAYNPNPATSDENDITLKGNWENAFDLYYTSKETGATLEYTFEGDSICWIGYVLYDAGKAEVRIDGTRIATVDQYSRSPTGPFTFKRTGLGPGKHKLQIIVLGEKNPKSRGTSINVRGFAHSWLAPPTFDAKNVNARLLTGKDAKGAIVRMQLTDVHGRKFILTDFDSVGEDMGHYLTWMNVRNVPKTPFTGANPLRSCRVE